MNRKDLFINSQKVPSIIAMDFFRDFEEDILSRNTESLILLENKSSHLTLKAVTITVDSIIIVLNPVTV